MWPLRTLVGLLYLLSSGILFANAQEPSAECVAQNEALQSNANITKAEANVVRSINSTLVSCTTSTCTVDLAPFTSDYESVCENEGGQVYEYDKSLTCSYSGTTKSINVQNNIVCVGASCDLATIGDSVDNLSLEITGALGLTCSADASGASFIPGSTTAYLLGGTLGAMFLAFIGMF